MVESLINCENIKHQIDGAGWYKSEEIISEYKEELNYLFKDILETDIGSYKKYDSRLFFRLITIAQWIRVNEIHR